MKSILSGYGLTPTFFKTFGISGDFATSFFGAQNVQELVQDVVSLSDNLFFSYNAGDIFDSMIQVLGNAAAITGTTTSLDIASQLQTSLQQNLGVSLSDIDVVFEGGVATVNVDGYGSNSVNVTDLLNQAVEQASPQIEAALNNFNQQTGMDFNQLVAEGFAQVPTGNEFVA